MSRHTAFSGIAAVLFICVFAVPPSSGRGGQDGGDIAADVIGFNGRITAMVPAPDHRGGAYVAGDFSTYRGRPVRPLVRLLHDGSLDETFRLARGMASRIAAVTPADDGSGDLYVADYAVEPAGQRWQFHSTLWRIHPDGTKDQRFAPVAFDRDDAYVPDARFLPLMTSLASVGDGAGRVYAAGRFGVVRINRDGSRDAAFRYGVSSFHVVPAKDGSGAVYVSTNERIAPSGRHAAQRIVKLKADGKQDPAFDAGRGVAPYWSIFTIVPIDDGSGDLFVGGNFAGFNDPNPHAADAVRLLARLNADGSLDRTSPRPRLDERHGAVMALARADDGTGDWLITQGHDVLRYSAEGARIEFAQGAAPAPLASAAAVEAGSADR